MRSGPNASGLSRTAVMTEVEHSLRRLGTDYIDLYQVHRNDHRTPLEETLEALHDLVEVGKVRYLGASSMHAWEFAKALHVQREHGWARFVSMQDHYNLLAREEEREMAVVTAPLVGANTPAQIDDAVASLDIELTSDELAALEKPYTPAATTRASRTKRQRSAPGTGCRDTRTRSPATQSAPDVVGWFQVVRFRCSCMHARGNTSGERTAAVAAPTRRIGRVGHGVRPTESEEYSAWRREP
jgi:diketogulonate reductase-like aldo/keto reductase